MSDRRPTMLEATRALERVLQRKLTPDEAQQLAWELDNREALEELGAIAEDIDHKKLAAIFAVFMLRLSGERKKAVDLMCMHANHASKLEQLVIETE